MGSVLTQTTRPVIDTQPSEEPVSVSQLKKNLRIPTSVTTHDSQFAELIQQAREKWEYDVDAVMISQTRHVTARIFANPVILPDRPITSITSIQYYDGSNAQQTLSTNIYELDATNRMVRLKYQQSWPTVADRWDAITITYVCGYTDATKVPAIYKRAMLLLASYWWRLPDMAETDSISKTRQYDALVNNNRHVRY